ncbi:MAG: UDP-3-O-(3-hydroxymyristoyl)glucosamine N-acyltransferase [Saprospiraceae bacterium]|nr:UDP-3-O-(3-hydroxymyristoyl)glucosamine N-acyltransferase [Saprospiraceae bacterium]
MQFRQPVPVKEIAAMIRARIIGDPDFPCTGLNEIHKVVPGDILFVDVPKYFQRALQSAASVIILNQEVEPPPGKTLLVVDQPFEAYDLLARHFRPFTPLTAEIADSAQIHPSAVIEPRVIIGPEVAIGPGTYVQAGAIIHSHTRVGAHVRIQAGAIIGTDAFYFKRYPERHAKWHTAGRVILEDFVDIGAGTTINRGVSGDTIIGEGTKIDCQVHIGHGAVIGKRCILAGQVGIGGKAIIGDNVVLYGQVGVAHGVRIGDGATVLASSGVSKDLEGGATYFGAPAADAREKFRELITLRHLAYPRSK